MTRTERSDRRERERSQGSVAHRVSAAGDWRTELHQAVTIARATFGGFLQSDVMPQGLQASATIWAAAFLAAPAMLLSAQFLGKYSFLERYSPQFLERAIWSDRGLFILLSSGAIGIVSVVMWDTLFPARRDVLYSDHSRFGGGYRRWDHLAACSRCSERSLPPLTCCPPSPFR